MRGCSLSACPWSSDTTARDHIVGLAGVHALSAAPTGARPVRTCDGTDAAVMLILYCCCCCCTAAVADAADAALWHHHRIRVGTPHLEIPNLLYHRGNPTPAELQAPKLALLLLQLLNLALLCCCCAGA
jgi:hypothetical protein